jgi:UDP-sugar transporter A1/2/3
LALFYCTLLAFQFGLQPILASKFTAKGVSKTSVVIATEIGKILISMVTIGGEGPKAVNALASEWNLMDSLKVALVPATLYAIQNLLVQYAYALLDSMTFNLLNQTKTLSAAFWLWAMMGKPQSGMQMVALMLLLGAAVILNMGGSSPATSAAGAAISQADYNFGLAAVIGASMLSGLSAALTQKALVGARYACAYVWT